MQQGYWTIHSCPRGEVDALSLELGLSEITASVLVRRGYGDPEQARAFLGAEPPAHDPFLLGDMRDAVETISKAIAARKRICVASRHTSSSSVRTSTNQKLVRTSQAGRAITSS